MLWWLAQNAVLAGALAVVVALACRLGRFRPAVQHALWLVVLLKLLTPPQLTWPGPVLPLGGSPGPAAQPTAGAEADDEQARSLAVLWDLAVADAGEPTALDAAAAPLVIDRGGTAGRGHRTSDACRRRPTGSAGSCGSVLGHVGLVLSAAAASALRRCGRTRIAGGGPPAAPSAAAGRCVAGAPGAGHGSRRAGGPAWSAAAGSAGSVGDRLAAGLRAGPAVARVARRTVLAARVPAGGLGS